MRSIAVASLLLGAIVGAICVLIAILADLPVWAAVVIAVVLGSLGGLLVQRVVAKGNDA